MREKKIKFIREALRKEFPNHRVKFLNEDRFVANRVRFLVGHLRAVLEKGKVPANVIVRIATSAELLPKLNREINIINMMCKLRIPTPRVIQGYTEITNDCAYFLREWLQEDDNHIFVKRSEDLKELTPELVTLAVTTIVKYSGKKVEFAISPDAGLVCNTKKHWSASLNTLWNGANRIDGKNVGLKEKTETVLLNLNDSKQKDSLKVIIEGIIDEVNSVFVPLLAGDKGNLYFVHNDCTPKNFYYNLEKKEALFTDVEYSCLTEFSLLAQLNDVASFYARSGAKRTLQLQALNDYFNLARQNNAHKKVFLKFAIMVSTFSIAADAADPKHPHYYLGKSLLKNFKETVNYINNL